MELQFQLTVIAAEEGPLRFRDPYEGEVFDVAEAQLIGSYSVSEKIERREVGS